MAHKPAAVKMISDPLHDFGLVFGADDVLALSGKLSFVSASEPLHSASAVEVSVTDLSNVMTLSPLPHRLIDVVALVPEPFRVESRPAA